MLFDDCSIESLPMPIARAIAHYRRSVGGPADRETSAMLRAVEETVRFATIELLAAAIRADDGVDQSIVRLVRKRRSFGDRVQLFIHAVRGSVDPQFSDLRSALGSKGAGLSVHLQSLVRLRNRIAHDALTSDEANVAIRDLVAADASRLVALELAIRGARLVSVFVEPRIGSTTVEVLDWMGQQPTSVESTIELQVPIEQRDLIAGSVLLIRDDRVSPLSPLLVGRDDPQQHDAELFLLETITTSAEGLRGDWRNVSRADGVGFADGQRELDLHRDRLASWAVAASDDVRRDAQLDSYYFASTPTLIERLLEHYVERHGVSHALDELFQTARSGSAWLLAGPGSGKSSVVASIVERYEAVHHFVTSSEGRNNRPAILRSLVAQLLRRLDSDELPHTDDERLPQQLANLLARRSQAQASSEITVLAIDAIDEIGDETAIAQFISSMPAELPPGVFLLASSRPLPAGQALPRGASQYVLDPLSVADLRQLARKHDLPDSARACETAFVASRGNPLLAVWALTLLRANPLVDLSNADEFDDLLAPLLAGPLLGPHGPNVSRMLAVLVASRSRLDLSTLAVTCGLERVDALNTINALRDVLVFDRRKVSLSHQTVRDYLLQTTSLYGLDRSDLETAHAALFGMGRTRPGSVSTRDVLWHAVKSGVADLVQSAMADPATREEFDDVLPELAAEGAHGALALLEEVGVEGATSLLADGACMLAAAGYREIATKAIEAPWSACLSERDRYFVRLELARAQDDIDAISRLAELLLAENDGRYAQESRRARIHCLLGDAHRVRGVHESALTNYERAVALAATGSTVAFASAFQLADLQYVRGDLDEAGRSLASLLAGARHDGDLVWEAKVLREIGHLDLSRDNRLAAAVWYERSLDVGLALGFGRLIAQGYTSLAEALAPIEPRRALEYAELGLERAIIADAAIEAGKVRVSIAEAHEALGELVLARSEVDLALEELIAVGYGSGQARARLVRARVLRGLGFEQEAAESALQALDYYRRERIYPHLWRTAVRVWAETAGVTDAACELEDIPFLDQLRTDAR